MTKAAIYARYSSDKQSEASIDDQVRLCEEHAKREGWQAVQHYADHGISGASLIRPGVQALLADAQSGKFEVVVAESLDRLSRDQEDVAGLYKRLTFAGVEIITLSEGRISELHIGLKGTMGALYLKDLADKTRRGLRGRVENGKSGGGNSFGYDVLTTFNAVGEPERGNRTINDVQAAIVRQIFNDYAAGKSPKAIARALNAKGVAGPSGKGWGQSTINGNWRRGTGILNNELYVGRLVWNRLSYVKNPDTGKRVSRQNPQSEWIIKDVPELRIIDQDLWDRVKERQKELRRQPAFHERQRPRLLLSGLLKCGICKGGFSKVSKDHYGCSNARNKGTCDNRKTIRRNELESLVLGALQSRLMEPALLEEFCDEFTRYQKELRQARNAAIHAARAELVALEKERLSLIQAIKDGVPGAELKDDFIRVRDRREELEAQLDGKEEDLVVLHPHMAAHYREQVEGLIAVLNDDKNRAEAAEIIRSLVDRIELSPNSQGALDIDLFGDLAGILSVAAKQERPLDESDPRVQQVKLVAGAGFEPATFRL